MSLALSTMSPAFSLMVAPIWSALPSFFIWSSSMLASMPPMCVSSVRSRSRDARWVPLGKSPLTRGRLRPGPVAELGQAAGQQPGDVHLADAEPGGDLRLRHPAEESEVDDHLLPLRQRGDQR